MLDKRFDPQKFIDREFEQELFEELLQLKDQARILAIKDDGGMGKSQLLQKFQYRCRTVRPRTLVSLVDLGQLPDSSPLSLAQQLKKELSAFLAFPTFVHFDAARRAYDFTTIRGTVDLRGADLRQAQIRAAGVMTNIEQAGSVMVNATTTTFTTEQQAMAQERCVQAFLADLAQHCQEQLVVIIFDGYEKCNADLQTWLLGHFLELYCFDIEKRPPHLVIVVAGRELPDFEQRWSRVDCGMIVKSVRALGKWTAAHVEECLRVHGYYDFTPQDVAAFHRLIGMGIPPSDVVGLIQRVVADRRKEL